MCAFRLAILLLHFYQSATAGSSTHPPRPLHFSSVFVNTRHFLVHSTFYDRFWQAVSLSYHRCGQPLNHICISFPKVLVAAFSDHNYCNTIQNGTRTKRYVLCTYIGTLYMEDKNSTLKFHFKERLTKDL